MNTYSRQTPKQKKKSRLYHRLYTAAWNIEAHKLTLIPLSMIRKFNYERKLYDA